MEVILSAHASAGTYPRRKLGSVDIVARQKVIDREPDVPCADCGALPRPGAVLRGVCRIGAARAHWSADHDSGQWVAVAQYPAVPGSSWAVAHAFAGYR